MIGDPQEAWRCILPLQNADLVKIPLFILNAQYDSWALGIDAGYTCIQNGRLDGCNDQDRVNIEIYRDFFIGNVSELVKGK